MKSKLTKKYYVPGLISALIIPLLFWCFGNRQLQKPVTNVMDLGVPAKYNPNIPAALDQYSFEPFRNWNYKKIQIDPNTAKENSKFYVSEIKNLQKRNEKNTGIEFILDDKNSYNDFVSILNDLSIAKHETYGLDLDKTGHVFALVIYKDSIKEAEPCYLCNDYIGYFEVDRFQSFTDFKLYLSNLPTNGYYIIFGFLLLVNVSMLNIKKFI